MADAPAAVTVAATFAAAPWAFKLNVAVVKVATFIGVLKLATMLVAGSTPVALASGLTVVTAGAGAVVKVQVNAVPSGTNAVLVTVAAMVAVYTVFGARLADGVSVAVDPDSATVAVTLLAAPAALKV